MTFVPARILALTLAAAAASAALTGCTLDESTSRPSAMPAISAAAPSAQLAEAARRLERSSFAMTLTIGLNHGTGTLTGKLDPVKKIGAFTASTSGRGEDHTITEWRILGSTLYAKTTTNGMASNANRPWRRLKSDATNGLATAFDAAGMAEALTKATAVRRIDGTHFTGTIDGATANAAFGLPAPAPAAGSRAGIGAPARNSVVFTADIDVRSRLIGYRATVISSTGGSRMASLTISDFGTAVTVQPPPPGRITGSTIA